MSEIIYRQRGPYEMDKTVATARELRDIKYHIDRLEINHAKTLIDEIVRKMDVAEYEPAR